MSLYVLPSDGARAYDMARRWESYSEQARRFAAFHHGKFQFSDGSIALPHEIARLYEEDKMAALLASGLDVEEIKLWF